MPRLIQRLQLALAAFLLLATVLVAVPAQAANPTLTVGMSSTVPDIGKVASGTSATNFTVAPRADKTKFVPAKREIQK